MTGEAGPPAVGVAVLDTVRDRVGRVVGREGPLLRLRPLGGGLPWDADPRHIRPLSRSELLSALLAELNARSRRRL
ncbi:hypothetical protein ACLGI4_06275 [Streptomyces sp. HMX112]|uniref:hypothetical protein n=1 Tax=Streptomyces sp. HMX112 TaxID=3390850 RepID=UPI003A80388C